jgi:hypothetical protein
MQSQFARPTESVIAGANQATNQTVLTDLLPQRHRATVQQEITVVGNRKPDTRPRARRGGALNTVAKPLLDMKRVSGIHPLGNWFKCGQYTPRAVHATLQG